MSPEFKLYLIKEFQRLKDEESNARRLEWNFQRTLSKVNYRIHTDAIKDSLIPAVLSKDQIAGDAVICSVITTWLSRDKIFRLSCIRLEKNPNRVNFLSPCLRTPFYKFPAYPR